MKNIYRLLLLLASAIYTTHSFAQTAIEFYNEGLTLKEAGKSAEALDKFRKAIALNPKFTDALYQAGWCSNDQKNYAGAISFLNKSRQTGLPTARTYFELGYAFEKLNKNDSAYSNYNKCLELNPTYSLAFKQLGGMAYLNDDYVTAMANYEKYEANAKAEIKDYLYWYRKGFMQNAQKEYAGAKVSLLRSLDFKTDYINTYLELGFACNRLKQGDEAIGHFKTAMNLDPKSHIPYNGIAEVYRDTKKDLDQAMTWYRKSPEVKPNERKACFGIGYCLNSKEKFSDAIPYLKTAIEQEDTYTAAYVELGYAYYKTGKEADAEYNFNKAIELNPKNENARYYACLMYIKQRNKAKAQKMVDELRQFSSKHVSTLQPKVDAL